MTADEMVGWHHQLNGHESEQSPGDGDGQGSLVCSSPWGPKELDTTERLNKTTQLHCDCFQLLTFVNKAAINIRVGFLSGSVVRILCANAGDSGPGFDP